MEKGQKADVEPSRMMSFDIRFAPLVISPFHCYSFNTMPEEQAGLSAYDKHEYDEIPGGMHHSDRNDCGLDGAQLS